MDIDSQMQRAETEISAALSSTIGNAMRALTDLYNYRNDLEKEVYVAALIGHLVAMHSAALASRILLRKS